jgi:hypothetical protein
MTNGKHWTQTPAGRARMRATGMKRIIPALMFLRPPVGQSAVRVSAARPAAARSAGSGPRPLPRGDAKNK